MADLHHTIERLKREQPKTARQQYAFFGALLVTLVIVGFWSLSVPSRLAVLDMERDVAIATAPNVAETSRWQNLAAGIASLFARRSDTSDTPLPAIPVATSSQAQSAEPLSWSAAVRAHQGAEATSSARTVLIATTSRASSTLATTSPSSVLQ